MSKWIWKGTAWAKVLRTCTVALALLAAVAGRAETIGVPDWQGSVLQRQGHGVALDAKNNAYLVSTATGVVRLDRYTNNGVLQWTRSLLTGATSTAAAVLVDGSGNAFVIGAILAKYAPDGTLLWSRALPGAAAGAQIWSAAGDGNGDILAAASDSFSAHLVLSRFNGATGATAWTITLPDPNLYNAQVVRAGAQLVVSAGNDARLRVLVLDAATGTILASHDELAPGTFSGVAVAPGGEIVAVGSGSFLFPAPALTLYTFDSSLSSVLLARSFADGVAARHVAVDAFGNIYLAGVTIEPSPTTTVGSNGTISSGPYADWRTMKLDAAGSPLWSARLSMRTDVSEVPYAMRLASDGSVYVTGLAGNPAANAPSYQATTVQYASTGTVLWRATSAQNQNGVDVARGSDRSVYVVGGSPQGSLWHYPALPTPSGLALSKSTVSGGTTLTGTVRVSNTSGAVVALTSSQPNVARVPATVTVPPGRSSASFTITTARVRSTTVVDITASANGGALRTALTVKR